MQSRVEPRIFIYRSPLGPLSIIADDQCLLKISFSPPGDDGKQSKTTPSHVESVFQHFTEYFENPQRVLNRKISIYRNRSLHSTLHTGQKKNAVTLKLDFTGISSNMEIIYRALLTIPPGEAVSYGYLAELAGFPRGARFAGTTMARNRFPFIIPCHRVIKADMSLGGYGPGPSVKRQLLEKEKFL